MGKQRKLATILLIAALTASSIIIAEFASAQSIPKPSVPEFTVEFLDNYYHPTIQITVENQPYPSTINGTATKLYYNFRTKNHQATYWNEQYEYSADSLPFQTTYNYSTLTYTPYAYQTGDEVDLQVEAILGYTEYVYVPDHPLLPADAIFRTFSSGWSSTQTFTMPNTPTPIPTATDPTTNSFSTDTLQIVTIVVAVAALLLAITALLLYRRK